MKERILDFIEYDLEEQAIYVGISLLFAILICIPILANSAVSIDIRNMEESKIESIVQEYKDKNILNKIGLVTKVNDDRSILSIYYNCSFSELISSFGHTVGDKIKKLIGILASGFVVYAKLAWFSNC